MINGIRLGRCCRAIRRQRSDIDGVFDSTYHEADCIVIINLKYAERTLIRCLIFIFCALFEQDKVTILIGVCLLFGILSLVILINTILFVLTNKFPVGNMLYIEYYVMSNDKLSWLFLQGGMVS